MKIFILSSLSIIISFIISLYSTPMARKAALFFKILDKPDNKLKIHKEATPYLGGVAIYSAILISLASVMQFETKVLGILLAGSIILLVGILDDLQALTPIVKLMGQLFSAAVIIKSGIMIEVVIIPWWLNYPLTIFWLLTTMNAINIIDIMDGLCTITAIFASILIAIFAIISENYIIAVFSLSLFGALLGFLKYNKPRAKIYLGDAGSMLIGLLLGTLCMSISYPASTDLGVLIPLLILGIPLFDISFVVMIRIYKKIPFFLGSPDHFAIRLKKKGYSEYKILLVVILISLILMITSISLVFLSLFYSILVLILLLLAAVFFAIYLLRMKKRNNHEETQINTEQKKD